MNVICIKPHSQGVVKVGQHYEVSDTMKCVCGTVCFDVGIKHSWNGTQCCLCGLETDTPIWWVSSHLFAPLEEKGEMFIEEFLQQQFDKEFLENPKQYTFDIDIDNFTILENQYVYTSTRLGSRHGSTYCTETIQNDGSCNR